MFSGYVHPAKNDYVEMRHATYETRPLETYPRPRVRNFVNLYLCHKLRVNSVKLLQVYKLTTWVAIISTSETIDTLVNGHCKYFIELTLNVPAGQKRRHISLFRFPDWWFARSLPINVGNVD